MELFAGLDIGTNGSRIVIIDQDLKIKYEAAQNYSTRSPVAGWAEQDPEEIFNACLELLTGVVKRFPDKELFITFSSVMHSIVGVDGDGNRLTPLIIWADTRSRDKRDFLEAKYGKTMFYQKTGCPLHSTYWPAKILWLKEAYPENIERFVSIKEYIVYRLCGRWMTDYSLVSTSGLYNHRKEDYDPDILKIIGVSKKNLSPIVSPGEQFQFNIQGKTLTGLMGATDGVLANLGSGAINRDSIVISVGSSAAVRFTSRELTLDPQGKAWCYILDEDYYVIGEATNGAGVILKWMVDLFRFKDVAGMLKDNLPEIPFKGNDLVYIPTMMGERGPAYNERIRGLLYGLSLNHTRQDIITAVYESIAFYTKMVFEDVKRANGREPAAILMTGGLGLSEEFMRLSCYLLGQVSYLPGYDQNTAVGAAMMAIKEIKNVDYQKLVKYLPQPEVASYPVKEEFKEYLDGKYELFLRAYKRISNDFKIYSGI